MPPRDVDVALRNDGNRADGRCQRQAEREHLARSHVLTGNTEAGHQQQGRERSQCDDGGRREPMLERVRRGERASACGQRVVVNLRTDAAQLLELDDSLGMARVGDGTEGKGDDRDRLRKAEFVEEQRKQHEAESRVHGTVDRS